jgi:hypothetical protein
MGIQTISSRIGNLHYAICDECKAESTFALTEGVAHSEGAINVAYPCGWTHQNVRGMGGAWHYIQRDFCPACSVAPEYRKAKGA